MFKRYVDCVGLQIYMLAQAQDPLGFLKLIGTWSHSVRGVGGLRFQEHGLDNNSKHFNSTLHGKT